MCKNQHGKAVQYVGMTQVTLARRLNQHLSNGSIKDHSLQNHETIIDKKTIEENTKILDKANNRHSLAIKEAIIIQTNNPLINKQFSKFDNILKLHHSKPYFPSNESSPRTIHQTVNPSQPNSQESLTQDFGGHNTQSSNQERSILHTTSQDNVIISQNASPNIHARIETLLHGVRQAHTSEGTPVQRSLRPRISRMRQVHGQSTTDS